MKSPTQLVLTLHWYELLFWWWLLRMIGRYEHLKLFHASGQQCMNTNVSVWDLWRCWALSSQMVVFQTCILTPFTSFMPTNGCQPCTWDCCTESSQMVVFQTCNGLHNIIGHLFHANHVWTWDFLNGKRSAFHQPSQHQTQNINISKFKKSW